MPCFNAFNAPDNWQVRFMDFRSGRAVCPAAVSAVVLSFNSDPCTFLTGCSLMRSAMMLC